MLEIISCIGVYLAYVIFAAMVALLCFMFKAYLDIRRDKKSSDKSATDPSIKIDDYA